MKKNVTGKVVLITGGSSGIGAAIAVTLQQAGYIVYAGARRVSRMKSLKQQGIHVIKLDVTDDNSMQSTVRKIEKEHGRIDILINCAGYGLYGAVEEIQIVDARKQMEVNLFGLARMTQLVLPIMRNQRAGKVINISSIGGKITTPLGSWYHASKFAVEGYSDSLRNEVKQFGIDVIVVEPGGVKTEGSDKVLDELKQYPDSSSYKNIANKVLKIYSSPINKYVEPQIIGILVGRIIKISSPRARYSSGRLGLAVLIRRFTSDRMYDRVLGIFLK